MQLSVGITHGPLCEKLVPERDFWPISVSRIMSVDSTWTDGGDGDGSTCEFTMESWGNAGQGQRRSQIYLFGGGQAYTTLGYYVLFPAA